MKKITNQELEDLQEFQDLVEGLSCSRFGRGILAQETVTIQVCGFEDTPTILNFDEEDCRSFLLGCRMLLQKNERVSVFKIWSIFKDSICDDELFVQINPPRWMLNDYLDQGVPIATPNNEPLTNRLLVDTFLYGSYAHLNRRHRARLASWQEESRQYNSLKLCFIMALKVILDMSKRMSVVVRQYQEDPNNFA